MFNMFNMFISVSSVVVSFQFWGIFQILSDTPANDLFCDWVMLMMCDTLVSTVTVLVSSSRTMGGGSSWIIIIWLRMVSAFISKIMGRGIGELLL